MIKRRSQAALEYAFVVAFAVLIAVIVMAVVVSIALHGVELVRERTGPRRLSKS